MATLKQIRMKEQNAMKHLGYVWFALALSLGACNAPPTSTQSSGATPTETKPSSPAVTAKVDQKEAAATYFKQKCVVCHGDHGAGDGPGSAALNPKPRAFGDATWQKSVTDELIAKTIVEGGAAVGKDAAMAANPDLRGKPELVAELVKIVRGFKK
jgi:mono/diheme cytochrome c family protein